MKMDFNSFTRVLQLSKYISGIPLSIYGGEYAIGSEKKNIVISEDKKNNELVITFHNVSVNNYPLKNIRASTKNGDMTIYIPLKELKTKNDAEKIVGWLINDCFVEKTGNGIFNKILRWIGKFF